MNCTKAYLSGLLNTPEFDPAFQDCEKDYQLVKYMSMYYGSNESTGLTIVIAIILIIIGFMLVMIVADKYLAATVGSITQQLRISPSIAAITFLALANGAPDIINSITSGKTSSGIDIAIASLFGSFMFNSTLVVANVIHNTPAKRLRIPIATFLKEISSYAVVTMILVLWGLIGIIDLFWAIGLICVYLLYLISSIYIKHRYRYQEVMKDIEEDLDEQGDEHRHDDFEKYLPEMWRAEMRQVETLVYLKRHFWNRQEHIAKRIIYFPFRVILFVTVPNECYNSHTKNSRTMQIFMLCYVIVSNFATAIGLFAIVFKVPFWISAIIAAGIVGISLLIRYVKKFSKIERYYVQLMCLLGSIVWVQVCIYIIVDTILIFSFLGEVKRVYFSALLISGGLCISDFFSNGALSRVGQDVMGLLACFSGQCFNLMVGLFFNIVVNNNYSFDIFGFKSEHTTSDQIFLRVVCIFAIGSTVLHALMIGIWNFHYEKWHKWILVAYFLGYLLAVILFIALGKD